MGDLILFADRKKNIGDQFWTAGFSQPELDRLGLIFSAETEPLWPHFLKRN
jgi:hypothetical protein